MIAPFKCAEKGLEKIEDADGIVGNEESAYRKGREDYRG
jgi:hypothetical protein